MHKKWNAKKIAAATVERLGTDLALHRLTAAVLAARGIETAKEAGPFLAPSLSDMLDPLLLRGMETAVGRLLAARRNRDTICIYGDYDVDGISGTALLVSFLRQTGFSCRYFIPNRFDDGYGLNREAIQGIIALGANLIVSVDCGITAVEEALFCREQGIDLIVVDHHLPKETLPDAVAVVNPMQPDCPYPFKSLAGVGVAFNLLVALRMALRDEGAFTGGNEPDLREWLDLVALGTIADVVPLTGQNRIFAFHGLKQLSATTKPGIQALKRVAGVTGGVSCGQVGFRLAPRLNAAGRMESAVPGVDLLLSIDQTESQGIAEDLDAANAERQATERRILDEAIEMVETSGAYPDCRSIILASQNWHQGVVGIVASRLVERYHRPTILISLDEEGSAKGSGRSITGFHLLDAVTACSPFLERFGGHRYAAGVGLRADAVTAFAAAFEAEAARLLTEDDLVAQLDVDAEAQPGDITPELARELKRLEPFGAGNPEPVLLMRGLRVMEHRVVGDGHLKLRLAGGGCHFNAIAFRLASRELPGMVDIAFFPEMNEWNGNSTLQLRVKDLRPTE
ncbi:single-stranded-DNA-specific exonuclease RecJ [Oryzomonas rubra]|uniref:Single-stranded-DNA-specific exonuclease RecJ n=1 Tax=Oryzomonas rubra TaxID=2509454 RepID=A0A5A9XRV9_9BACT|nr:single-stranded-DNA-specific exonuclease RecJ [Oryzomonas rubra]KAA0895275.1 single-stranded-DNA-specific exonuclease RecJ [Oryzomonas rubra]